MIACQEVALQFSKFTSKHHPLAIPLPLDRDSFIEMFSERDVRTGKDGMMFAPATITGSRAKGNFVSASGICLDFDEGQADVKKVLELFPDTLAAYYSTHSHGWTSKEKKGSNGKTIVPADTTFTTMNPRFRVVLPLSRPVNADEHAQIVLGVKSLLPLYIRECLDATCFEKTRAHYLPSCLPQHEEYAFSGHQDGAPLDVEHFIKLGETAAKVQVTAKRQSAVVPSCTFEFADPRTGEVHDLAVWAAQNPTFDLVGALGPQYHRGKPKDGKQHIVCPFQDQHSDQVDDLATFAVNASPPQFAAWDVHCCHAHCVDRDRLEYLQAFLEKGWISADHLQAEAAVPAPIGKRRPPRIYYPVNDINAAPEWSTLIPDERQKGLHLMTMMWAEDDGMIEDDDWRIARNLGVSERDWKEGYRPTFERAGWLVKIGGRLTTPLAKREFDSAQAAYMRVIERAAAGGKSTQEKRSHKHPLEAPA